MADYVWPVDDPRFKVESFAMGIQPFVQVVPSNFGGGIASSEIPGARWVAEVAMPDTAKAQGHQQPIEAFLAMVRGPANRLIMGHLGHRFPAGTLSGAVLSGGALQGALTMTLIGIGKPAPGDMLTVITADGNQWVMVTKAVEAPGGSDIWFSPPLRAAVAASSVVTYLNTTTRWIILPAPVLVEYRFAVNTGVSFRLIEVWN